MDTERCWLTKSWDGSCPHATIREVAIRSEGCGHHADQQQGTDFLFREKEWSISWSGTAERGRRRLRPRQKGTVMAIPAGGASMMAGMKQGRPSSCRSRWVIITSRRRSQTHLNALQQRRWLLASQQRMLFQFPLARAMSAEHSPRIASPTSIGPSPREPDLFG